LKGVELYNLNLKVYWCYLGNVEYEKALDVQTRLASSLRDDDKAGYLLLLEHPPTITLGYSLRGDEGRGEILVNPETLAESGIKVYQVDRGGKATYHGPGQLVGYPVLDLRQFRLGAKRYIGKMESMLLRLLSGIGVDARIDQHYPGLWVGDEKIAALGVRIQNRLTTHGFALNLDPQLEHFNYIIPCGIPHRGVNSLARIMGEIPSREELIKRLVRLFSDEFKSEMIKCSPDDIWLTSRESEGQAGGKK
jgi:lipoyl(octanoyl) transferase